MVEIGVRLTRQYQNLHQSVDIRTDHQPGGAQISRTAEKGSDNSQIAEKR